MPSRLSQLLMATVAAVLAGFLSYPLLYTLPKPETASSSSPSTQPAKPAEETPTQQGVVIDDSGAVASNDGSSAESDDDAAWDDSAWEDDGTSPSSSSGPIAVNGERSADSYMPTDSVVVEETHVEDDVPVDEAQNKLPPVCDAARNNAMARKAKKLASTFEKQEKKAKGKGFTREEFTPDRWKAPDAVYKELTERVLSKLGKLDDDAVWAFMEEPANRLDLATLSMIQRVGVQGMSRVASRRLATVMLSTLTSDLDWMTGLLYSGPTDKLEQGLVNLAAIYARFAEDMGDPVARRIATTAALEFAREGWSEKDMMDRYIYYYNSYKADKLNVLFNDLQYWETRLVTGCTEPGGWGSVRSLAWQRDNVRLPVEGYLSACYQINYRLRNVAGDSVFSGDYLAPILKYTNNTTAWAHREIGGVCGACSHYGAYAALAAGLPAMTMGEPGHCAYTVRVNGSWEKSYSIYWQHGMHKTFWHEHAWDFLILMQKLYDDRYATLVSDQMAAMAEFLAARRKMLAAFRCYEDAVVAQPLNWPVWLRYTAYLREKAPNDAGKWKEVYGRIVDKLAPEFHNAAATLLTKYVYPTLISNVKDRKELNKLFSAFFKQCKGMGTNRWDIGPLLNAQIASCTTPEEQAAYIKDALKSLMDKPEYAGSVLSWGLDFISSLPSEDEKSAKMQEEFTDLVIKAMSRARTTRKERDATWAALGEAIYTAASNKDRKIFQAIGKLAYRKCKKNFPKNRFRFRSFPGKVVSSTGLITTSTTLDPGQMPECSLHWAVLQRSGGRMPCKFEGDCAVTVMLENTSQINGVICLFSESLKNDRTFILESSADGQNWSTLCAQGEVSGAILRFDCRSSKTSARYVRVRRDGDKYEPTIVGCYVYGKPLKNK